MRVLLAYDGSAGATEAVALAEAIAWPGDSVLRVVSVIEPNMLLISVPWDGGAALAPELDATITAYAKDTMCRSHRPRLPRTDRACSPAAWQRGQERPLSQRRLGARRP